MDNEDMKYWREIANQLDRVFRMLLPMKQEDISIDNNEAAGIVGNARDRLLKLLAEQSKLSMEADYSFCLEMTIKDRLPRDYAVFITEAKKMQAKLTKEQKLGMLHAV